MKFAEIKMRTMFKVLDVEIDKFFVSEEAIEEIKSILNLEEKTAEELTAIRNTMVRTINDEFIDPAIADNDYKEYDKYSTKLSGITAVIDHQLYRMGEIW